ncbi:MAG: hypothetical protein C4K58_06465 [Flavobacteriaceae bacterium]|nr:MAG: hypothetical protein C4K58_06465 [Flavobacteriaceae bacterium]
MKQLLFLLFLLPFFVFGQKVFEIKDGSKLYNAKITMEYCDDTGCSGEGLVQITKKEGKFSQTLVSEDLWFYLDEKQKPSVNIIQLYDEQSPLIFEDFNFDGYQDLAVRNGNHSSYGGPSYDVYVFNITRGKFVISDELTTLATENLGMFQTDSKRKRLITFNKSGCCWHVTTEYAVIPKKGLQKVYELEEDATNSDGETVSVTTRILKNGKWVEKTKKYKLSEFYPE